MLIQRNGLRAGLRLGAGLGTVAALLAGSVGASAAPSRQAHLDRHLVVRTGDGKIRGKAAGAMDEFLGIPYAAPPVGPLRWRPPHPAARWRGIREATAFGPHCPQPASAFGVASTSEDCLYLNVFAPAGHGNPGRHGRGLPVMVWIHGGSLLVGESDDYNPAGLVRHGVIVVTLNYRVGALGFLADSALAGRGGGPSGNYGLMDQQAALRWVRANIGRFGGDRKNVTIFGESAGGLSVLSQLASKDAKGLFARAVVESGSYNLTQTPLASAEAAGDAFAAKAGCTSDVAACLRKLPVQTIIDNEDFGGYHPDIDGRVLTQSIGTALASGQFNRVPVMIGTNHDEWLLFIALDQLDFGAPPVTASNYRSGIEATLGVPAGAASAIAAEYPLSSYPSASLALGAVGTDAIFACPALTAEQSLAHYVPTFAYEFSDENAPERFLAPDGFPYGAAHASEIQYLFKTTNTAFPGVLTSDQKHLAALMKHDWTSFASLGSPARSAGLTWPRFELSTHPTMTFDAPGSQVSMNFATEHNCAFWAKAAGG